MPVAIFVGESRVLRWVTLGMIGLGLLTLLWDWPAGPLSGASLLCIGVGAVMVRVMPWHFEVLDNGLELWFSFGRRVFLPKENVTVRVDPGSPVALVGPRRRIGYPLTDGLVEHRRASLRAALAELGFDVA